MAPVQLVVIDCADPALVAAVEGLAGYLRRCGDDVVATGLRSAGVALASQQPEAVLVYADRPVDEVGEEALLSLGERGAALLLAGPTVDAWRSATRLLEAAGMGPGRRTPVHEIRLRPGADGADVVARMGDELLLTDRWVSAEKVADDIEVLLTANLATLDHPVMTLRRANGGPSVGTCTVGSLPQTVADPAYQRLVHRWLRAATGRREGPSVRVGLLGYGAIGAEHTAAIAATAGLELVAAADPNPVRREAARAAAAGPLNAYADSNAMLADSDVDLVLVSTPPNSHAEQALRALMAGRSVVVEKPLCLTVAEADRMISAADERGLTLAVYQNRRWDADYLALKRAVRAGAIGEVFHYESFVGGYAHPCNYWHSDEAVSGGAVYDWGSHYLDWMLDLLRQPVAHVTANSHKRVWYDVTNADHTRVTVRFDDGVEAQFVHSDLAAALKPKWYVLGTHGAVRGDWRQASVLSRGPVGALVEDELAPADAPAQLRLFTPGAGGGLSETLLAVPPAPVYPFHRELADHLLSAEPMTVTAHDSRRGVAIMEAATASAAAGGVPVRPAVP